MELGYIIITLRYSRLTNHKTPYTKGYRELIQVPLLLSIFKMCVSMAFVCYI